MTDDSSEQRATHESFPKSDQTTSDHLSSQRVFKKSCPNNKLTLYLSSRDLMVSPSKIDRLQGVLLVDPEFVEQRKVYGQVTLTFRYGREDEEVMGLKFCNEAVMCLAQLYPPHPGSQPPETYTPLQDALMKRLGPNSYPFTMEITHLAPPSVQLVPAKEYNGAPIGTSYDIRAYVADRADEKLHRRTTIRMGIRVVQRALPPPPPFLYSPGGPTPSPKQRNRYKMTLFSSRSVPLEAKDFTHQNVTSITPMKFKTPYVEVQVDQGERKNMRNTKTEDMTSSTLDNDEGGSDFTSRVEEFIDDTEENSLSSQKCSSIRGKTNEEENKEVEKSDSVKFTKMEGTETTHDKGIDHTSTVGHTIDADGTNQPESVRSPEGVKILNLATFPAETPPPHALVEKSFLLSDGRVELEARLNKAIYSHGEEIQVMVNVRNKSNKTIRRIKVFVVQHVDVCMFSNGKFKNVVAMINTKDGCPLHPGAVLEKKVFTLIPTKSMTKNWIALEDSYSRSGVSLASSVANPDGTIGTGERNNVFAIYVSYYVKVKLQVSVMGGEVSLKLPFTLMHTCDVSNTQMSSEVTEMRSKKIEQSQQPEEMQQDT